MRGLMIHWPGSTRNQSFESGKLTISLSIPPPPIFSSSSFRYFLSPKALFFFFFEIQGFEGKKKILCNFHLIYILFSCLQRSAPSLTISDNLWKNLSVGGGGKPTRDTRVTLGEDSC